MLAYLDCFSGISGDMLLGALVDAGLDLAALREGLAALPLSGYALDAERAGDHGLSGLHVRVRLDDSAPQPHRRLADIEALLDAATALPAPARETARAFFRRLAEAEARVHGSGVAEVTFHELGALDSIVDLVGIALGLHLLGIEAVYASALPLTGGRVRAAHGPLPVPAPATLALLEGSAAEWRPVAAEGELVTPTGAAVLATLARFERPALRVRRVGYGFGQRALPWANCLRLVLGEAPGELGAEEDGFERDEVVVMESNLDTMTGEELGWLMERLLGAGALDVGYVPLQMKKGRPGALLTLLARPEDAARLAALVVRESRTLGVRLHDARRLKAGRRDERVETPLGPVRVKLKLIGGEVVGAHPEYDDCRALAAARGLPFERVRELAERAAWAAFGAAPAGG